MTKCLTGNHHFNGEGEGLFAKETVVLRRCVAVWGSQETLALSTELKMQTCHHKEFSKLTYQSLALGQNEGLTLYKTLHNG